MIWFWCKPAELAARFRDVRGLTESLVDPLEPEDCVVQSMPDVSPTKWHLAHVTWFFEKFVLEPFAPRYAPYDDRFHYLFNSYYYTAGEMHTRRPDLLGFVNGLPLVFVPHWNNNDGGTELDEVGDHHARRDRDLLRLRQLLVDLGFRHRRRRRRKRRP